MPRNVKSQLLGHRCVHSECRAHILQAAHNYTFARSLVSRQSLAERQWAIIVAFYCLVHLAESLLVHFPLPHPRGTSHHDHRASAILKSANNAYAPWDRIRKDCDDCRYRMRKPRPSRVQARVLNDLEQAVKDIVASLP